MRSFKHLILLSFILLTLIGDGVLFYAAIRDSRSALQKVTLSDMITTAEAVGTSVNTQINEKYEFLKNLSYTNIIQSDEYSLLQKQQELNSITEANDSSSSLIALNITNTDGGCYLSGDTIESVKSKTYFYQASIGNDFVYGPVIVDDNFIVYISVPTYDESKSKITGVIYEAMTGDFLCDIAGRSKLGETGYTIIVDRTSGNTIGSPDPKVVQNEDNFGFYAKDNEIDDLFEMYKDCLLGNTGSGSYVDNGKKMLIAYAPISDSNWSAVVIAEHSEFTSKLTAMEHFLFTVCILLIIAGQIVGVFIARALNPLAKVGAAIKEIASGNADLTHHLDIKNPRKEIADVTNGFNEFVAKMNEIVTALKHSENDLYEVDSKLQESTQDSVSAITQIIANIQNVNSQITHQSESVTETASAVNQIASNIESLERMIEKQSQGVTQASSTVEEMIQNISSVNGSVDQMVSSFGELEQNATVGISTQSDVNDIIKEIDEQSKTLQTANAAILSIASQTNLLAMNAAIEAAHAGDAGKGFSVVADEIRKLSETSSVQSRTIGDELKKVQTSIERVVLASSKATTAFQSVSTSIQNTDQIIQHIKDAMDEQEAGSQQIISALHTMNDSTLEVKSASAEMGNGNKLILSQIENLQAVTDVINGSITEMLTGAEQIHNTGATLADISNEVTDSIKDIGKQINQFKV